MKKLLLAVTILLLSNFAKADEEVTQSEATRSELTRSEATPVETAAREPAAVHTVEQAKLRQYPGGRDEQDIKIQASLPLPTKNIDGSPVGEMAVPDDHDD